MGVLRHTLRSANSAGFALTLFFALLLLVFLLTLLQVRFEDATLPMAPAFAVVGGLSLVAMVALLGFFLLHYMMRGTDLRERGPRLVLFSWTCAGCVFFLSQTLALIRFGGGNFPHVPGWLSALYWYFCAVGAAVFLVLIWVNAEGGAAKKAEDEEFEEQDAEVF